MAKQRFGVASGGHNYGTRKSNPEDTLKIILDLIHRDVKSIRRLTQATLRDDGHKLSEEQELKMQNSRLPEWKMLDAATSTKLVKYASALSTIINEQDKFKSKSKKELDKLETEELVELYNAQKNGTVE